MLATASPALAAKTVSGASAGTGTEDGGEIQQNCDPLQPIMGTLPQSSFELAHTGTWKVTDTAGATVAIYAGPHTISINIAAHVISPEGTYIMCNVPGPVPVQSWDIKSPNQGNQFPTPFVGSRGAGVTCTQASGLVPLLGNGTYERRATSAVHFELSGKCSVQGGVAPFLGKAENVDTIVTIEGTMEPCVFQPAGIPNPACGDPQTAPGSILQTTLQAGGVTP